MCPCLAFFHLAVCRPPQRFQERNSHSVDFKTSRNMYSRWEVDDDAIVLTPYGCDDVDLRRRQKVQFIGLMLDKDTKAAVNAAYPCLHPVCCLHESCRRVDADVLLEPSVVVRQCVDCGGSGAAGCVSRV